MFWCSGGVPVVVYTVRLEYQRSGAVAVSQLWCIQDWNTSVLLQWRCPSCGVYSRTGILAFWCSGGVPVVVYTVRLEYQRSGTVAVSQLWCIQ